MARFGRRVNVGFILKGKDMPKPQRGEVDPRPLDIEEVKKKAYI